MNLNLKGTLQEYYFMLLFQLRVIPPYHVLQTRESELLSHLMALDMAMETDGISLDERGRILFGYDTKIVLMEIMKITDSHYRNLLQMLRKKGFVNARSLTSKVLPLRIPQQIIINFKIQREETEHGTEDIREEGGNSQRTLSTA